MKYKKKLFEKQENNLLILMEHLTAPGNPY
jgi:hypothetical protein